VKAYSLLNGAALGPDSLKIVRLAFDQAWDHIRDNFATTPTVVEGVRLELATAILQIATDSCRDADVLAKRALEVMGYEVFERDPTTQSQSKDANSAQSSSEPFQQSPG
jgi:hypothetical protein